MEQIISGKKFIEKNADGGEQEAQSYKVELGMDYNRDGEIDDADFGYSSAAEGVQLSLGMDTDGDGEIEFTEEDQQQKEMLFWVNDDKDEKVGSYTTDDGKVVDIEDDVESSKRDCDDDKISCKRDLEDFARLQIRVDEITAERMPFEYYFKIEKEGNETPPNLNLFEAVKWNQFYIHLDPKDDDSSLIDNQLNKRKLVSVNQSKEMFAMINPQKGSWGYVHPYLFEGSTSDKGKIVLIVKGKDQNGNIVEICRKEAKIHLEPIRYFYDSYILELQEDGETPKQTVDYIQIGNYQPQTNDYVLFVHGWNMEEYEKDRWTETVVKRLWWQGYKGKVAEFEWPNRCGIFTYNKSELRAWRSGEALKKILEELHSKYGDNVCVLAHSQGNIVLGEALKLSSELQLLKAYVATQGAISSHHYDNTVPVPADWNWFKTPNVIGHYHSGNEDNPSYMEENRAKVKEGKIFNYFNEEDYALSWWESNNKWKPEGIIGLSGYHYKDKDGNIDTYNPNPQDPKSGDRFYYDSLLPGDERTLTFEGDRYEIFTACAESRAKPIGNYSGAIEPFSGRYDLKVNLGYDNNRYSHSREFRSDIIEQWKYWERVMVDFGLKIGN